MNATYEQIQQDHKELQQQLVVLHRALCERHQSREEIVDEFSRLRDHLADHFLDEEEGGFFTNLVQRMPHHAERIEALRMEHVARLHDLDGLIDDAANQPICPDWWEDLARRFHEVSRLLMAHELTENELLQEAYGLDLGAFD